MNKSLYLIHKNYLEFCHKRLLATIAFSLIGMVTFGCQKPISTGENPTQKNPPERTDSADSMTEPEFTAGESGIPKSEGNGENSTSQQPPSDGQKEFSYAVLHWNVESGGSDPPTVAAQLVEIGKYDVVGLSEVDKPAAFELAMEQKWPGRYQFIRGLTGINEDREDDHLWIAFNTEKFALVNGEEMTELGGFVFDDGHHRVPLYVRLQDKTNGQEVVFVMNHLARGDKQFRQAQARTLREWARTKSIPIVAIGDYNLDFVFATERGNPAFDEMMRDNVWKWVRPEPLVDTNWSDRDGDGVDNYIDSLLDFSFVAGAAKTWQATSRVIVRENDFPDDDKTSDHRPVELILKRD